MTVKYHISPKTGNASVCKAENGNCPFGGESGTFNHFDSLEEARSSYEDLQRFAARYFHDEDNLSNQKKNLKIQEIYMSNSPYKMGRSPIMPWILMDSHGATVKTLSWDKDEAIIQASILMKEKIKNDSDLEGRVAVCGCGKAAEKPSSRNLPFYNYQGPGSPRAREICGNCGMHASVHTGSDDIRNPIKNGRCSGFTPQGDTKDEYYCGHSGWD